MFKLFKKFDQKEFILLAVSIALIALQVWLDLKIPDYMSEITELVETEGSEMGEILSAGGMMVLCALGCLVDSFIVGYIVAYVGTSFEKRLRKDVFMKVEAFSMTEIKKFSTSSLITRTTNDITQIKSFIVMGFQVIIRAPLMAILAISKIADKGFEFSLITAVGVIIVVSTIAIITKLVLPKFNIIQTLTDNLNRITRENLTGIRVVRAYNAEKYQTKKFETANDDLTKTNLFTQKVLAIMNPMMSSVMSGISLAIYWVGAFMINSADALDKITIFGNTVVFSSYAVQVIAAFMMLIMLFILYPRARVSARRINEVLDTEVSIKNGTLRTSKGKGLVEFKHVSFKYPDAEEYILKDISFKARPGETVAFIGSTGSGKSTLINLVPRFYDATDGEVLVDGENVKDYDQSYLMDKIGYVSQKAVMFKGTVKSNITFGATEKVPEKTIKTAAKIAAATEFVDKLPDSYASKVSQSGTNLSGGQKQRLSIARAVAKNPEIYIFDDSFSALDYQTDFSVRKALNEKTKDATKLIVAQRIGTIKDADQILVLDNGRLVGRGKHEDLLKKCKVYREIAYSQLNQEELENA